MIAMDFGNRPSAESYIEGPGDGRTGIVGFDGSSADEILEEAKRLWDALNYIVPSSCFRPFKRKSLPNKSCNQLFCFQKILFLYLRIENQIRSFNNPETTEKMETQDLFPEDFIVALPKPSNYVGPNRIFAENGEFLSQLSYSLFRTGSFMDSSKS